jgi:hypothetical protein
MTVRYRHARGTLFPIYMCQREGIQHGHALCQHISGTSIDDAMGALVIDAMSPLALEVSLGVQQELHARLEQADALRRQVSRSVGSRSGLNIHSRSRHQDHRQAPL